MVHLTLEIKVTVGTDIQTASNEAVELANRLNIFIEFDFNMVTCIAIPNGDPNNLVFNYQEQLKGKSQYPIATTHKQ